MYPSYLWKPSVYLQTKVYKYVIILESSACVVIYPSTVTANRFDYIGKHDGWTD
jgi:hypothetical protein